MRGLQHAPFLDGMEWPDDGDIRCWECQHELLRFFKSRCRSSPQMDGNHRWRFDNASWPIQHLRGPTIDDAIRNMMEAMKAEESDGNTA